MQGTQSVLQNGNVVFRTNLSKTAELERLLEDAADKPWVSGRISSSALRRIGKASSLEIRSRTKLRAIRVTSSSCFSRTRRIAPL
jgi:uncharacterized protein (DUF1697 family)